MDVFDAIPAPQRDAARAALAQANGGAIDAIVPVLGGASGASIFRVETRGRRLLLRIEGPAGPMLARNPHHFTGLAAAALAGVAPAVRYLDEASGVIVTDFIDAQPLATFPGGRAAMLQAMGELLRELQAAPPFPPLVDYRALVTRLLRRLRDARVFADGLLEPHAAELKAIIATLDWDPGRLVASHNDPHPGNLMFDGQRLWLIDWESGYRNDPMVDVAIAADSLAGSPELEDRLLAGWLGRPADDAVRARLGQVRRLTRLYYAAFLLGAGAVGREAPETDLSAPTPGEVRAAVSEGRLVNGSPAASHLMGKVFLDGFLTGRPAAEMQAPVAALA